MRSLDNSTLQSSSSSEVAERNSGIVNSDDEEDARNCGEDVKDLWG